MVGQIQQLYVNTRNQIPGVLNFPQAPVSSSGISFRDVLASNKQSAIATAVTFGSQRDSILDTINQARVNAAPEFNGVPAGAVRGFNIQDIYDMPPEDVKQALALLKDEISYNNFSGMSGKEIYERIENKFIEVFGEDFMMGFNLLQHVPGSVMSNDEGREITNYEYIEIGRAFNELVSGAVGFDEMFKINRERLYGNKSDMEIIDDIIAKYPERLTIHNLAMIVADMQSVGINDNIRFGNYLDILYERHGDSSMSDWSDYEKVWNSLLKKPANVQEMAFQLNGAIRDEGKNPYVMRARDILVKLGAVLGPNGLFLDPDGQGHVELNVDFTSPDSDDLFDEFLSDLEEHDEDLKEARELLEENSDAKDTGGVYEPAYEGVYNYNIASNVEYSQ